MKRNIFALCFISAATLSSQVAAYANEPSHDLSRALYSWAELAGQAKACYDGWYSEGSAIEFRKMFDGGWKQIDPTDTKTAMDFINIVNYHAATGDSSKACLGNAQTQPRQSKEELSRIKKLIEDQWHKENPNAPSGVYVIEKDFNNDGYIDFATYSSYQCGSQGCTHEIYSLVQDSYCFVGRWLGSEVENLVYRNTFQCREANYYLN